MVLDQIIKAAASNHGITLQPLQVQELTELLAQVQIAGQIAESRLRMAIQLIETIVAGNGGTLTLDTEIVGAANQGFSLRNEEGTLILTLGGPEGVVESEVMDEEALPVSE